MSNDFSIDMEVNPESLTTLELEFEDGTSGLFAIVFAFDAGEVDDDGNVMSYIAIAEYDKDNNTFGNVDFKRYSGDLQGELTVFDLDTDEEYEMCCDIFEAYANANA